MKTSASVPTVTDKWPIEVPTHQYASVPTVFKIFFGKKYFIWKGKSLLQSCQNLAESLERYIRLKKDDDQDYLYHVAKHVRRTRCLSGTVKVIDNDFIRVIKGVDNINGYAMLIAEQKLLDAAKRDPEMCLNNNVQAYIPGWITPAHKEKFELFYETRNKRVKK